jgi:hypothetical protein
MGPLELLRPNEECLEGMLGVPLGLVGGGDRSLDVAARRGDFGGAVGNGLKGESGSMLSPSGELMKLRGRESRLEV